VSKGKFIVFEGGEGTGKSTQVKLLYEALLERKMDVIKTREPGGSAGAEKIRDLLVRGDPDQWDALTEATLFLSARREHVECVIKPALAQGKWVICDRYHDSTIAYSSFGEGVERSKLDQLYKILIGDFEPDLVILLDIDPKIGLARAHSRHDVEDRIEKKGLAFHKRVNQGFRLLANENKEKYKIIDATQSIETIHQVILQFVE